MNKLKTIKLENGVILRLCELHNDYGRTYQRVVNSLEVGDLRKTVGGQKGQHKHRKPD